MPRKKDRVETESKFTCPNVACGLVFPKPLKVKNLSAQDSEVYDACPRCLTEITSAGAPLVVGAKLGAENDENVETASSTKKLKTQPQSVVHCSRHFGYLSERSKNETIPDECVICENIVKCMLKAVTESPS
jgi:hypothetical protein